MHWLLEKLWPHKYQRSCLFAISLPTPTMIFSCGMQLYNCLRLSVCWSFCPPVLFSWSPTGDMGEIEIFATHKCISREISDVLHDIDMWHWAKVTWLPQVVVADAEVKFHQSARNVLLQDESLLHKFSLTVPMPEQNKEASPKSEFYIHGLVQDYSNSSVQVEDKSDLVPTKDTPYLTLTGKLWVSIVRIFKKIDRVIMTPHCICSWVIEVLQ